MMGQVVPERQNWAALWMGRDRERGSYIRSGTATEFLARENNWRLHEFRFTGTIRRVTVEEIEVTDGIIDVTKKAVCRALDLPPSWSGDPTHWVGEIEEALVWGAPFKMVDIDGAEWQTKSVTVTADHIEEAEYAI